MARYTGNQIDPQLNALNNVMGNRPQRGFLRNITERFRTPTTTSQQYPSFFRQPQTPTPTQNLGGGNNRGGLVTPPGQNLNQNQSFTPPQTPQPAPQIASSTTQSITPGGAARAVYQAGQMTPWEQAAAENVANAKGMQNFGQFAPNAEAPFYAGANEQQMRGLITMPDLVARGGANQDLYNKFANLYGTQSNVGLQAAQTAAERGLTGAQSVLGAAMPQAFPYGSNVVTPLNMQSFGAGGAGQGGAFYGGQIAGQQAQGQQVQEYSGAHQAALNLQSQLGQLISNAGINPADLNAINTFVNRVATNVSDPNYQTFNNLINDLASRYSVILTPTGGNPTDYRTQIAHSLINAGQSGQSIMQVIDNLNNQAEAVIQGLRTVGQSGTYSGGGGTTWNDIFG